MEQMKGFGHNVFTDPARLPDPQRALHRLIQAAARADRQASLELRDEDEARWPGLVAKDEAR